ncbi:DMT family transporter [Corynebacterium uropygiale]|uniref:DMT family transporter n=1 Tax=Corynebacterium uropygiale TaxID=1775911 RepID=A0A9X1TYD9_9CORY|nr:DMT family transporter [Corynebacterium uropygiale]
MTDNFLSIVFALASALTIAWGTAVRHRIAEAGPSEGSAILTAIRQPLWWAGLGTSLLAYGLQILALGFGPLLIVQPILVMSLMFTLPISALYDGRRMPLNEILWAAVLCVAVAIVVLLGRPVGGVDAPNLRHWAPALIIGAVVLGTAYHFSGRLIRREKALVLGLVTGALFGFVAVFSKAVADALRSEGVWALLTTWEFYALVLSALVGTAVQQIAFDAGALRNSLPAMKIGEPIVAFILGYAVLGESFQVSGGDYGWLGGALVVMIVSTVTLSRKGLN